MRSVLRFILFFSLSLSHFALAQIQQVEIVWDKEAINPFTNQKLESFDGAYFEERDGFLPRYHIEFPINSTNANTSFSNLQFASFSGNLPAKIDLGTNVEFTTSVAIAQKRSSLSVNCIPF